jgi:hypothetical protein
MPAAELGLAQAMNGVVVRHGHARHPRLDPAGELQHLDRAESIPDHALPRGCDDGTVHQGVRIGKPDLDRIGMLGRCGQRLGEDIRLGKTAHPIGHQQLPSRRSE